MVSAVLCPHVIVVVPVILVGAVGGVSNVNIKELLIVNGPAQNPLPPVASTVYVPACD